MKPLFLASFALLAGCASTQTILDREADETHLSDKSPATVAACLADLNNTSALPQDGGGYLVTVKSMVGMTGFVFTVAPNGDGSEVTVRRANTPVMFASYRRCF